MSELKPCPFCGERDNWLIGDEIKGHHVIACDNCGAKGPYDSKEWNTRASEWVSVDERLPNDKTEFFKGGQEGSWGCSCLLSNGDGYNFRLVYFDSDDNQFWKGGKRVTGKYWYAPPKPPTGG